MNKVRYLVLLFWLLASPLGATDIDYFAGLEWGEAEAGQNIRLLAVHPYDLPDGFEPGPYQLLIPEDNPSTRFGDLLAHVIRTEDGVMHWLQEDLIMAGEAVVMPVFETNADRLLLLKARERAARLKSQGLWAGNPVVCADEAGRAFDTFAIIQGRITDAASVRGTIYLNFGADYRDDFTVKIPRKTFRSLTEETRNRLIGLTESANPDTVIEARGWVFYSGGPMIEMKTDAQLDFFEPGDPFILERC